MLEDGSEGHFGPEVRMFLEFYPALLAFFRRHLREHRDRAEDLAQDTIYMALVALRRQSSTPIERPIPFILTIARRRLFDEFDEIGKSRQRAVSLDDKHLEIAILERVFQETRTIERERLRRIREALSSLDEQERAVLVLRRGDGLTNAEVAAKLSLPPAEVSRILYRAQETIRVRLLDDESGRKRKAR
jgi:RNA polymerase sigma factor (sigma-70 family)